MFKKLNSFLLPLLVLTIICINSILNFSPVVFAIAEEQILLNENLTSIAYENKIKLKLKDVKIMNLANDFHKRFEEKKDIDKAFVSLKAMNDVEYIALNDLQQENKSNFSVKQKKAQKQIGRRISKIVEENFGIGKTVYSISPEDNQKLDIIMKNDDRIKKLALIVADQENNQKLPGVKANAGLWENCEVESNYDAQALYSYKYRRGFRANWAGKVANDWDERYKLPCDYKLYSNWFSMNRADGWTYHAECVIRLRGYLSRKIYSPDWNNAAIIGWGSMAICGGAMVPGYYKDRIDFYDN